MLQMDDRGWRAALDRAECAICDAAIGVAYVASSRRVLERMLLPARSFYQSVGRAF
jgi:hypothetical protein